MESPSTTVQLVISTIPIAGILMGGSVILLYLIFNHKQKMLMLEKGVTRKPIVDFPTLILFTGFSLTGVGLGLTLFFLLKDGISYGVLSGLIPLFLGLSLISFFLVWVRTLGRK
jgi:hypothetical protein